VKASALTPMSPMAYVSGGVECTATSSSVPSLNAVWPLPTSV
jgi:hypothetical protein